MKETNPVPIRKGIIEGMTKTMKFAAGVTIKQIGNVIDWILADMKKEQLEAREAYKTDSKDIFHGYMDTMYGFVEDMIRSRLSILCDEKESDSNM